MKWGKVEITWGFCLTAAWLNYLDRQGVFPLALAACSLHELGHYAVIRWFGGDVKVIRLTAVGAEMKLDVPLGYLREGLAALAGPGINLLAALVLCRQPWGRTFSGLNLVLGCFNMMPVRVMDGGRALHCTLALLTGAELAESVGRVLDRAVTAAMLLCGALLAGAGGNISMLLVALWLGMLCWRRKGER